MPRDVKESTDLVGWADWAEMDLVPVMVETLIEDAGASPDDPAAITAALKDARQIVRAVEAHYKERIENLAAEYLEDADDQDELSTFAYYLVMQSRGHGVAWSDDHEGELWTPEWDAAMWFVDEYGPEEVENPRRPPVDADMKARVLATLTEEWRRREQNCYDTAIDAKMLAKVMRTSDVDQVQRALEALVRDGSVSKVIAHGAFPAWRGRTKTTEHGERTFYDPVSEIEENPRGTTRLPSVKTIRERLRWLDKTSMGAAAAARFIRKTMEAADPSRALRAMDNAIDTYGVEYIPSHQDSLTDSRYVYGLEYLNTGDPYIPTVIYDWGTGSWKIEAWGDIVERSPRRFGE
jgi:hypothetical protein